MQHDYDEIYETRVSRPYGNSKIGVWLGSAFVLLGMAAIAISIADVYRGVYVASDSPDYVFTWDENPIWPSYGKGFWVGLIFIATGVVGIVSYCEHTVTSIYAFIALSAGSATLGFYLLISAIVPVQKLAGVSRSDLTGYESRTLGLNSVLMGLGGLGLILGFVSSIISGILVGCCTERRGYGAMYLQSLKNPLFYKQNLKS